ncbi:MAG: KH domain-containing protein [Candidatus Peregrinibacteria bacterium]|nr:KH domain-containing protein [Candidatus Peregrinibacteria bacterium]
MSADPPPTPSDLPGLSFLRFVLESLVEDKDELKIEAVRDNLGVLLTVSVSSNDMGKLIGRGGQTVKALRTLLRIIGGNTSERINLKILEPQVA